MQKYLTKLKELRAKHHKTEQVKCLHQVIKQTDAVMKKLKMKLVGDSVHQELIAMETELATRKQKHRQLKLYQQCKRIGMPTPICGNIAKLHRELHSKDAVILHLANKNLELEDIIEQLQCCSSGPLQKESKTFPQETSMFLYEAIVNHVPTRSVPILLNKFAQRSGLDSAPHCTTVEMMARELRVVAVLQAAELLMTNMNVTLGLDSTTQEGMHINSVHINSVHINSVHINSVLINPFHSGYASGRS